MEADYIEMLLDGAYRAAINDTNFTTYAPNALVVVRRKRDLLHLKRDLLHSKRDLVNFKRDLLNFKRDYYIAKETYYT